MITWDENYGEDADGNRGWNVTMYKLEDTKQEREEIAYILYERDASLDKRVITIEYEGVDIEVIPFDYTAEVKELERLENE